MDGRGSLADTGSPCSLLVDACNASGRGAAGKRVSLIGSHIEGCGRGAPWGKHLLRRDAVGGMHALALLHGKAAPASSPSVVAGSLLFLRSAFTAVYSMVLGSATASAAELGMEVLSALQVAALGSERPSPI